MAPVLTLLQGKASAEEMRELEAEAARAARALAAALDYDT